MNYKTSKIHKGTAQFKDEATGVAGEKIAAGRRGGRKQSTTGGVSTKTGYRGRTAKAYKAAPGAI